MTLPSDLDPECRNLCEALNQIPGIVTVLSCSGHGQDPFSIWFRAETVRSLVFVTRAIDRRYSAQGEWVCQAIVSDLPEEAVAFWLHSGPLRGREAYEHADKIAEHIRSLFVHEAFFKSFWSDWVTADGGKNSALVDAIYQRGKSYDDAIDLLERRVETDLEAYGAAVTLGEARRLVACLRRLVKGRTAKELHDAFGPPGDFGYHSAIGDALYRIYRGES